jgi:phage/plasmid-associated DNA primase
MAELEYGEVFNAASLKCMTGEEEMAYRSLYAPEKVNSTITFTPFLTSNETTPLRLDDYAITRRFIYFWFKNRYMTRDDIRREFPAWDGTEGNLPPRVFIRDSNLKKEICNNYVDEFIHLLLEHTDIEDKELEFCDEVLEDTDYLIKGKDSLRETLHSLFEHDKEVYTDYHPHPRHATRNKNPAIPKGISVLEVQKALSKQEPTLYKEWRKVNPVQKDFTETLKARMPRGVELVETAKNHGIYYKNFDGDEKQSTSVFIYVKDTNEDDEDDIKTPCLI